MKKIIGIIFVILSISSDINATHNRAGEITLTQLDEFTYEIQITTFTYTKSLADRSSLDVQWGDNSVSTAPRIEPIYVLPNYYQKNIYKTTHTFPGPGTYEIVVQDPNRNMGVKNIPNSVNVIFSIKTTISINPLIGQNSTPILLNPPIDRAALDQTFIHNPAAFDPDGDSLSYKLTVCTEKDGKPIENYELPSTSDTIYVDPINGNLIWEKPDEIGIYNIAIDIEEWRNGVKIGNIVRDMQIEVYQTENNKPEIDSLPDICVVAGTDVYFRVIANDPDAEKLSLSASGGPMILDSNPATLVEDAGASGTGHVEADFLWQTNCSHVRQQNHNIVFKVEDDNSDIQLVDLKSVNIKIIGAPPPTPVLIPSSNSITLNWQKDSCSYIEGYNIYRKENPSGYTPDSCVAGVPEYTGYKKIASLDKTDTIYFDDGNGSGLRQGIEYCYLLTSTYPDEAESYPSDEVCSELISGVPSVIQVSVTDHSESGDIELRWIQVKDLDTIPANGPFEYVITRYKGLFGQNEEEIFTKNTADISDTVFTDINVNTLDFPYSYSIVLYNNEAGNRFLISDTATLGLASSSYPVLTGNDNQIRIQLVKNAPWINYDYTYYRLNESSGTYDSIAYTTIPEYTDRGLRNGKDYYYMVKTTGWSKIDDIIYENENWSHINHTQPVDSTPPCQPFLNVSSNCEEFYNTISWSFEYDSCLEDVNSYQLFFSSTYDGTYTEVEGFDGSKESTQFLDYRENKILTGCYQLAAIDSFANESLSYIICVDECTGYDLPNVFSPNNDKINDLFIPKKTSYVEKVDFQVFNRWGQLVFQTEDPDINWDGKISGTNKLVSTGVYYYICEVFEHKLSGLESYTLTGFIHVYSGDENEVIIE